MVKYLSRQPTASYSLPARQPAPVMRTWTRCHPSRVAPYLALAGRWVAGALDSAWRAVDRYLALHYRDLPAESNGTPVHNPVRRKFWESWGGSEYWDEKTNEELVQRNHKVSMRNLMINVMKDIPDNSTREKSK